MRRHKFFGLIKSLFKKTTHQRLPPSPTDARTTVCIWKLRSAMERSESVVRRAVSSVVASVDESLGDLKPFNSTGNGLYCNTALNRRGAILPKSSSWIMKEKIQYGF